MPVVQNVCNWTGQFNKLSYMEGTVWQTVLLLGLMPFFQDSEQLYTCLRALFERLRQQEEAMRPLTSSRLVIRLRYMQPEAEVTVNARHNPVQVAYGPAASQPVLDVELAADTFHHILLDKLSVRTAMAEKQIRVNGPFMKAMLLVELFRQGQKVYPEILRTRGLI